MSEANYKNLATKKRRILGPFGRLLMKLFKWEIKGKIPDLSKMILIGLPHTAMRDAWYALLAVWSLDLKINFFGAAWIFTRLPSLRGCASPPGYPNWFIGFRMALSKSRSSESESSSMLFRTLTYCVPCMLNRLGSVDSC